MDLLDAPGAQNAAGYREAYACDCDGVKRTGAPKSAKGQAAKRTTDHQLAVMRSEMGEVDYETCPWRAFFDNPDLEAATRLLSLAGDGPLVNALPVCRSHREFEAARTYTSALSRASLAVARKKQKKPKPGGGPRG